MFSLGKYSKFWIALISFVVVLGGVYFGAEPWFAPLVSFLGVIGVYSTPNK